MKKIFNFILFYFLSISIYGQIAYELGLPTTRDTVVYLMDRLPEQINPEYSSMTDSWNFRSLQAPFGRLYIFKDPEEGEYYEYFENSDLVLIEPNGLERYYKTGEKQMVEIGFVGNDPFFPYKQALVKYEKFPASFRSSIQRINHESKDEYSFRINYHVKSLPIFIQNAIPQSTDTIEVLTHVKRVWNHLGTGNLILPDDSYEILAQKREDSYSYELNGIYKGKRQRIDISKSEGLSSFWKNKTEYFYHFYQKNNPFELAILQTDTNDKVVIAKYVPSAYNSVPIKYNISKQEILAYPNPTFGDIRFSFLNYPIGTYRLEVYNVIGKKIWSDSIHLDQSGVVKENLVHLRKGTYLYSIFDDQGRKLTTKRLMIITP